MHTTTIQKIQKAYIKTYEEDVKIYKDIVHAHSGVMAHTGTHPDCLIAKVDGPGWDDLPKIFKKNWPPPSVYVKIYKDGGPKFSKNPK